MFNVDDASPAGGIVFGDICVNKTKTSGENKLCPDSLLM